MAASGARDVSRVVITEESEPRPDDGFAFRHPTVAYVFGDTARGLYVVGCLALDLFTPLQVHLSFPSLALITLPSIGLGVIGICYPEVRLYRRLWPASLRRKLVQFVVRMV